MKYSEKIKQARDRNTSPEMLALLAQDEDANIRWRVADNINTSAETLMLLARDENESVRYTIAENINTLPEMLILLAQDKDKDVREVALQNMNYVKPKKRDIYSELEQSLAQSLLVRDE
jgi:HEAT repeat protein